MDCIIYTCTMDVQYYGSFMKTIYMCTSIERRSKLQFPFNHIEYYRCSITTLCMYYYTVYCKHTCHVVVVVVVDCRDGSSSQGSSSSSSSSRDGRLGSCLTKVGCTGTTHGCVTSHIRSRVAVSN